MSPPALQAGRCTPLHTEAEPWLWRNGVWGAFPDDLLDFKPHGQPDLVLGVLLLSNKVGDLRGPDDLAPLDKR